jgi:predicted small lipoprotein YifL
MLNSVKSILVLALTVSLAGCGGTFIKPDSATDRQETVEKRAQSRWDALIKGDLAVAYEYLSPGTRSMIPLDVYRNKIRLGLWKKANVESVSCEVDRCEVNMLIESSYRDIKAVESRLKEIWLLDDGNWWYVPK